MKIVSPCLARDLPVYRMAHRSLLDFYPEAKPHVITRASDFRKFRDACGSDLELIDEDSLIPGMRLADIRAFPLPFFPAGAGWYFQQFLKWAFQYRCEAHEAFLIWDADTVILRRLDFSDDAGRTLLTTSLEHHEPYFLTFGALLGFSVDCRESFISQHQWVQVRILREMIDLIEGRMGCFWPWAILQSLKGEGTNLFSEYETYGHYLLAKHPDQCRVRTISWSRDGRNLAGYPPHESRLRDIKPDYAFLSFESNLSFRGWCINQIRKRLQWYK